MTVEIHWLCLDCHELVWPGAMPGMTSRRPKECEACGQEYTCVLAYPEHIEKARQMLAAEEALHGN